MKITTFQFEFNIRPSSNNDVTEAIIHCETVYDYNTAKQLKITK